MKLSGAEIIIECLKEQKTDTIFGYPGGTVISVYDALYRRGKGIRHILTSHEQGAAHAADGYARSTGRTGVCLVTSGPGATNLVTGIATAYMDSVPVVAITINVSTASLGKDSFQEVDIAGITMPVTKHNFIVRDIRTLADTMRRAFSIARTGRPGPVLVDITRDVAEGKCVYEPLNTDQYASHSVSPVKSETNGKNAPIGSIIACETDRAAEVIMSASKPLLLIGGGAVIAHADDEVRRFCSLTGCPTVHTLMGKGVYPDDGEYSLGMAGIYGTEKANHALSHADVVIALGCRFSERVTGITGGIAGNAFIIHIDIDRAEISKNVHADLGLNGDASEVLHMICDTIESYEGRKADTGRWKEELFASDARKAGASTEPAASQNRFDGPQVVSTVCSMAGEGRYVTSEVGLNQMWTAQNYVFRRSGHFLTSGGLGTMGYGLCAAIGAAAGHPGERIINFAGDGCFRMNMNELLTAHRYGFRITEIILDNRQLGMVHEMQRDMCAGRYSETEFPDDADYVAIASAMGIKGRTVATEEELKEAFADAEMTDGPYVIVARV